MENIIKRKRHIAKTFTWRIVGTIDTMLLGWLIIKLFIYYGHETIWEQKMTKDIKKIKLDYKRIKSKN